MPKKNISDQIADKLTEVTAKGAEQALVKADSQTAQKRAQMLAFDLGQIIGVKRAADYLSVRAIRAIEDFIAERAYLGLGFANVTDFLRSDFISFSKHQYYDAKKLVGQEGEEVYEMLESFGIPQDARLKLGPGDIRLENDHIIIADQRIPAHDQERILTVIKSVVADNQTLKAKTTKQEEQIKQGGKDLKELRKQLDQARKGHPTHETTPHDRAVLYVVEGFKLLTDEAASLSVEDAQAARAKVLALLDQQRTALLKAYRYEVVELEPEVKPIINKATLQEIADAEEEE